MLSQDESEIVKQSSFLKTIICWLSIISICLVVIFFYAYHAILGNLEVYSSQAKDSYYNLLIDGFLSGQLNIKRNVPMDLSTLGKIENPIKKPNKWTEFHPENDREWMRIHKIYDLSYYKNKFYLYFGLTPALTLFLPYKMITGQYLSHKNAVIIFFSIGFLINAILLRAIWRRYFPSLKIWIVLIGISAIGLTTFIPAILSRAEIYEVAISGGYAFTMLTLVAFWFALHHINRQGVWLSIASIAFGLAIASRPSLIAGSVILLIPIIAAWRDNRPINLLLLAAFIPIICIAMGMMYYNKVRFDKFLDFGQQYQLPIIPRVKGTHQFSPKYFLFNLKVGFITPATWNINFPFVRDIVLPKKVKGIGTANSDHPFGILTNIPLVWLTIFIPLIWNLNPKKDYLKLRWFIFAIILLFFALALTLCFHDSMCLRYELEYTDLLIFLAVICIFLIEHRFSNSPFFKWMMRCGWCSLLIISLIFNILLMFHMQTLAYNDLSKNLLSQVQKNETIQHYI